MVMVESLNEINRQNLLKSLCEQFSDMDFDVNETEYRLFDKRLDVVYKINRKNFKTYRQKPKMQSTILNERHTYDDSFIDNLSFTHALGCLTKGIVYYRMKLQK